MNECTAHFTYIRRNHFKSNESKISRISRNSRFVTIGDFLWYIMIYQIIRSKSDNQNLRKIPKIEDRDVKAVAVRQLLLVINEALNYHFLLILFTTFYLNIQYKNILLFYYTIIWYPDYLQHYCDLNYMSTTIMFRL